jgi:non-ribosomal peptide synthetase component F
VQLSYRGRREGFEVPGPLLGRLKALGRRENATLFMVVLAAFQVLLGRYSGQQDLAVGTPVAGRNRTELEGLIGYFVNTLVLRADLSGEPTFREFLGRVRHTALQAYTHQELPFDRLVAELSPQRELSRNPLYQVSFALQNLPEGALRLGELRAEPLALDTGTAKFDLSMTLTEVDGVLQGSLEYSTDLFERGGIERMAGHFVNLLQGIVADADRRVHELPLLGEAERERMLVHWNDTPRE